MVTTLVWLMPHTKQQNIAWHSFLCVYGYIVVGQFITQSETAKQIQEAHQILQTWNPECKSQYFMCDYSELSWACCTGSSLSCGHSLPLWFSLGASLGEMDRWEKAWIHWQRKRSASPFASWMHKCTLPSRWHTCATYIQSTEKFSSLEKHEQVRSWLELNG